MFDVIRVNARGAAKNVLLISTVTVPSLTALYLWSYSQMIGGSLTFRVIGQLIAFGLLTGITSALAMGLPFAIAETDVPMRGEKRVFVERLSSALGELGYSPVDEGDWTLSYEKGHALPTRFLVFLDGNRAAFIGTPTDVRTIVQRCSARVSGSSAPTSTRDETQRV